LQFNAQFLTQYRGGTAQTSTVIDRFGWATIEVDIEECSSDIFRTILSRADGGISECVFHDGIHFWVEADSVNTSHIGDSGSLGDFNASWVGKGIKDLKNFQPREQRRTSWNSFGFRFFERFPVGHFFTLGPGNLKNYRPGKKIEWDDTSMIGAKYSKYLSENLVFVDGIVLCRIERPCFTETSYPWRDTKVFTPFGGHGDPVLDYRTLYSASFDDYFMKNTGWRWRVSPAELVELDRDALDPNSRSVRAIFMDLFRRNSWLLAQTKTTKSKASKKVLILHDVWKTYGPSTDEAHLDEVVDVLLTITDPGAIRDILDAWVDRPISL
jgi:hypothetical protein